MIQNISIERLHSHPDNPRKDIGDLSELVESIKARGVLQNLTVVEHDGDYRIVIGHRRCEAAKLAGLTELPCVIAEMDHKEQVATMLLENMQRSDLTVYEQAQGIQMMLDFGETIGDISEKTGFSETTVRRRVKLLELDPEKFKESSKRSVTLTEYMELARIEDLELRNRVLEFAGTSNFNYELRKALDEEKKAKWIVETRRILNTFAEQTEQAGSKYKYVNAFYPSREDEVEIPGDAGSTRYFYTASEYGSFTLYREIEAEEGVDEAQRERERLRAKVNALQEISDRAYNLRREFVREISNSRSDIQTIVEHLTSFMGTSYISIDPMEVGELLGLPDSNDFDELIGQLMLKAKEQPRRYLLVAVYSAMDSLRHNYFNWKGEYHPCDALDRVYDFLEALGYEMSDEERALRNGTHGLFTKEELDSE